MPGHFRIILEGLDGTWLTLTPRKESRGSVFAIWPLIPLIGGTTVVVVLSVFTARRILSPLTRLTHAAERLGIERESMPILPQGLGEFSTIAKAFNDMQSRLKRFVDERTQMLAAISHDLRTSLTRLKLALENVGDEEQKREMAKEIDEMEAMISATLSFASGDIKSEPSRTIDVASLLISVCDDMSDRGARASYEGPDHARLSCQPVMMKRALTNVIDNAVKFGNEATISLAMMPQSAVMRVRDDGPGIPAGLRAEAFAPFRRLENYFLALWEKQRVIPESWKDPFVFFDGLILLHRNGNRYSLYLSWNGVGWHWYSGWIGNNRAARNLTAAFAIQS